MIICIKDKDRETYILNPTKVVFSKIGIQDDGSIAPPGWVAAKFAEGVVVYWGEKDFRQSVNPEIISELRAKLKSDDLIQWERI